MKPTLLPLWNLDEHLSTTKAAFDSLKDMIRHSRESLVSERTRAEAVALHRARTMKIQGDKPISKKEKEHHAVMIAFTPVLEKYGGYLPRLMNYACLLQLYTLFEDRGVALCNELERRDEKIPVKLSDFGSREFLTIKTYLTKLCGVEYKYWSEIELLYQLRHRIVHNNGHTDDKGLIERIEKMKGLEIFRPYDVSERSIDARPDDEMEFNPDMEFDPGYTPPITVKTRPLIVVKNAYIDRIVEVVSGLFDKVFKDKNFGGPSPFSQRYGDAPYMIQGTGKTLKVTVLYQD